MVYRGFRIIKAYAHPSRDVYWSGMRVGIILGPYRRKKDLERAIDDLRGLERDPVIVEREKRLYRYIAANREHGYSYGRIAVRLQKGGVLTPHGGRHWTGAGVKKLYERYR